MQLQFRRREEFFFFIRLQFWRRGVFFFDLQFFARAVVSCLRPIVLIRIHLSPPCVSALLNRSSWGLAKNVVSKGDRDGICS